MFRIINGSKTNQYASYIMGMKNLRKDLVNIHWNIGGPYTEPHISVESTRGVPGL